MAIHCSFLRSRPKSNQITTVVAGLFWSWGKPPRPPDVSYDILIPDREIDVADLSCIPLHIKKPSYAVSGKPEIVPSRPVIWSDTDLTNIRESCGLARQALNLAESLVAPGVTTSSIDCHVRDFILANDAYPSPLNFKGFPKSISCSVNNVAAHGIPDDRQLQEGDIVNIDVTVYKNGFHGDCSDTFPVGEVDPTGHTLIKVARECLDIGICTCRAGQLYRLIGKSINQHAREQEFSTVQVFLGHGIGTFFHGPPDIYHCLNSYPGKMEAGMVFTVEPCISEGDRRIQILRDGWTAVTVDNSRTAQTEHTILITATGAEILTK